VDESKKSVFEYPEIDQDYLYHVTLGKLADCLRDFKKTKNLDSLQPDDAFERRLLDVYRHYLTHNG